MALADAEESEHQEPTDELEPTSHARRDLLEPAGWTMYLAPRIPRQLVVFLHGFGGEAVSTWDEFPEPPRTSSWWQESDLLFVGYDSKRRTITGVAHQLLDAIEAFYPQIRDDLGDIPGVPRFRPLAHSQYESLYVVGHSLGGVIIRHAMIEALERSRLPGRPSTLLSSQVRLFSPASAGFQAAGVLGLARATPGLWRAAEMYLRRSSAYSDLQPGSEYLRTLRARTERLAIANPASSALRPAIVWADPDDVVICARYDSDPPDDSELGQAHRSVCKPTTDYPMPWRFVETGRRR